MQQKKKIENMAIDQTNDGNNISEAYHELEESEKRFRSIIENTSAGYFFIDKNGIFQNVNKAWLDLYKYDKRSQVIGRHFTEVQRIEDKQNAVYVVEEIMKGNANFTTGEFSRMNNDGTEGFHSFSANPVTIKDETIGIEGFIFDITSRIILEDELKEANKLKDKFFSIISHDLRSPFSALLGLSGLLKENFHTYSEEKKFNFIDKMHQSIHNMSNLVNELLAWRVSQEENLHLQFSDFELSESMAIVCETMKAIAEDKSIELECVVKQKILVHAHKESIKTIIRNLVSNAIKFSYENSKIYLIIEKHKEAASKDEFAIVKVIDNGVGISEEIGNNLFKIDQISSLPGTKSEKGSGLGLMLSKDLITKNGGEIGFKSGKNNETCFWITIPLANK
jgi:PAS domain S-box-containing protein